MWVYTLVEPRRFERISAPDPGPDDLREGQVLLRTLAGGICGSDLPAFVGYSSVMIPDKGPYAPEYPGYPMHEVVGEVVASAHSLVERGTRVVGWAEHKNAIAEYVVTEGDGLAVFDDQLEPTRAIAIQPLACVLYAVDRLGPLDGRAAAVIGQGPIGILFSALLKNAGARRVTGVDVVDRSDVAPAFGVDDVVFGTSERWASQLGDHDRPEVVVEAVGHQGGTLGDAIDALAPGGLLYYFGIPEERPCVIDLWKFLRKQLTMKAGTTGSRRRYLRAADQYLRRHPQLADEYITDVFDVADVGQAFEVATVPAKGRLKVVVDMA